MTAFILRIATAGTFFVDTGNPAAADTNPGTEASPFRTINHAASVVGPGDTVIVKAGTYNVGASEHWAVPAVNPARSGAKDSPITFRAAPDHKVIITTSGGQAAFGSSGRDYICWEGFTLDTADRAKGVLLMGARGCTIAYCEIIGNYIATNDNHDGIRIERAPDTRIHHCIIRGIQGNSVNSAGIKVYNKGVKNVVIEDNYFCDNTAGVFDKDLGLENTYRRNYFTNNRAHFNGNNQGGIARYYIYDNVFDGPIELHSANCRTQVHDNLIRSDRFVGAWAGGVSEVEIWNNIVVTTASDVMACNIKKQPLERAIAFMDYNLYTAPPRYAFGEYTDTPQRFILGQMQSLGHEKHSQVLSDSSEIFPDQESWSLAPRCKTAGRDGNPPGPEDIQQILTLSRYGPAARN